MMDIDKMIDDGELGQALAALTRMVEANPGDAQARYRRGRLLWRLGDRAGAITDYEHAAAADPSGPAAAALQMSRQIMDYFNPDLLNP